ncbi:hypothetical protein SK128_016837 [Halocaridina rubra]|uniref:Uncharacterized protein n=1 Tax=Halocaridina rubra TaxID=373956 RepID=A0AAN9A093_HALRR
MAHVTTKCQEKNPSAVAKQKTPREGTTDASSRNKNKVSPPAEGQGTCENETPKPSSKDNATNCSPPTGDGSSNTSSGDKAKILSSTKDERQNGDALRRLEHAKEMNRSSETQQQEPVPRLLQQARENIEGEPDREATTVITREMASSQEGRDDGGGEDGRGGGGGGRDSLDVQQRRLRQIGLDLRRIADNFQAENGRHLPTIKRDSSQMTTRGVHVAFSQCLSLSILCLIWWKVMNKKD